MDARNIAQSREKKVRAALAEDIENFLADLEGVMAVVESQDNVRGPLGGMKSEVLIAVKDGRGARAALVVVYCDENIDALLRGVLEADAGPSELRKLVEERLED